MLIHSVLSVVLRFNKIPLYGVLIISFGGALLLGVLIQFVVSPWLKNKILEEVNESDEFELEDLHVKLNSNDTCEKKETIVLLDDNGEFL